MTGWPIVTVWRQLRAGLITLSGLLIPFSTAVATPEALSFERGPTSTEQRIAAHHTSHAMPSFQTRHLVHERGARGRIADARRVLKELQSYIEETARTVELDHRLKIRKRENDRLKETLSSSLAARTAFEDQASPMEDMLSGLTRTVIRNWLETVRLTYQSDEAQRELIESERSWLNVEKRAAALRQTLITRRAQLRSLRTESAALSDELNRTRRQVTKANAEARLLEHQQGRITAATEALRRNVTSKLRKTLLESGY